ncbi:hypothetical protein PKF023_04840 [Polynucleobacter yangtzensis]|uniref:Uncharacterized protein n=1 Tax=Polynucleobacter yangtzensis TaxID=1743159 RepID=A0A9C7FHP2_9BURK|nr:hypothetical protein PKF023_04840 [Polynucleobacter yangtzensis]
MTLFLHALSKLEHRPTYVITDVIELLGLSDWFHNKLMGKFLKYEKKQLAIIHIIMTESPLEASI